MSKPIVPPETRFWSRVNKNGPLIEKMELCCWEYVPPRGYKNTRSADFNFGSDLYGHKCMGVGRASWILTYGTDIPLGKSVVRRCGNYKCVRPEHLFIGDKERTLAAEIIDADGVLWKRCSQCKELFVFNKENFGRGGWRKRKFRPYCRKCATKVAKRSATAHWERLALYRAKDSSKEKQLSFDLSLEFISELFEKQGGLCYWLGIPMQPSTIHRYPFHPSLDRLDREGGYTKDNVVLCCQFMNVGRNSCSENDFISALKLHPDIFGKGLWNNGK